MYNYMVIDSPANHFQSVLNICCFAWVIDKEGNSFARETIEFLTANQFPRIKFVFPTGQRDSVYNLTDSNLNRPIDLGLVVKSPRHWTAISITFQLQFVP